jgi:hypothetical protein
MKKLIDTFVTQDGVRQTPSFPNEVSSGGFVAGGWPAELFDRFEEMLQKDQT